MVANLSSGSSYSSGYAGSAPASATIPQGATSVDFDISVTDNNADAAYGTLTWTLPRNDAVYSRGDPHSVSLVIADDEIAASVTKPEVYEFHYFKHELPKGYYLPKARYLADGTWTISRYAKPATRNADGSLNKTNYWWSRDLYLRRNAGQNQYSALDYFVWFHPGFQPTGPVTLTVKAVDHADNSNAETGRVGFALDLDPYDDVHGADGPFTDDELVVVLDPEDLVRESGGEWVFRPGFRVYVSPLVNDECVDVTHTISGGGYSSVAMDAMRVHLLPVGRAGVLHDRVDTACGNGAGGYLHSPHRTTAKAPGYVWMSHDLTGSRPVAYADNPPDPLRARVGDGAPQIHGGPGDHNGNPVGSNAPAGAPPAGDGAPRIRGAPSPAGGAPAGAFEPTGLPLWSPGPPWICGAPSPTRARSGSGGLSA